jgi:hypothetical protein
VSVLKNQLTEKVTNLQEFKQYAEQKIEEMKEKRVTVAKELDHGFDHLLKTLNDRREELRREFLAMSEEEEGVLKQEEDSLTAHINTVTKTLSELSAISDLLGQSKGAQGEELSKKLDKLEQSMQGSMNTLQEFQGVKEPKQQAQFIFDNLSIVKKAAFLAKSTVFFGFSVIRSRNDRLQDTFLRRKE